MSSNEAEQYKDEIKLLDRFSEKQKEDLMAARLENDRVQGILWRACHAILKRQHNMGDVLHQIMFPVTIAWGFSLGHLGDGGF